MPINWKRVSPNARANCNKVSSYRSLFLQEQRRAQHLSLINTVGKCSFENIRAATLATSQAALQVRSRMAQQTKAASPTFCTALRKRYKRTFPTAI